MNHDSDQHSKNIQRRNKQRSYVGETISCLIGLKEHTHQEENHAALDTSQQPGASDVTDLLPLD